MNNIIIGAGLAGLSSAHFLQKSRINFELYEKDARVGGLCKSDYVSGFTFDRSLHLLHLQNPVIKKLILTLAGEKLLSHARRSLIYYQGDMIPYPFQIYFSMLSNSKIVDECIEGLKNAELSYDQLKFPLNLKDWFYFSFGKGIADYFMMPYNQKLWKLSLKELSTEWTGRYVPKERPGEILRLTRELMRMKNKNLELKQREYGYNVNFFYPIKGGIEEIPRVFLSTINSKSVHLNEEVVSISIKDKELSLSSGERVNWDFIISTIPLPKLVTLIEDAAPLIRDLSGKVRWISIYNLNFGVLGKSPCNAHWIYVPESEYMIHRVGMPSNLSSTMAPLGTYSISTEVSYSKYCPLEESIDERIIDELMRMKFLRSRDEVIVKKSYRVNYAYVIMDHNYSKVRTEILSFLERHNIFSIGRYGSWEYSAMENAVASGRNVVHELISLGDDL